MRPSVRLSVVLWLFVLLAFVTFFVSHLAAFIQIFFTHSGISLTQAEALNAFEANKSRTAYIPKIIHQVFHNWKDPGNDTLPGDWNKVRQTCIDKNPGWTYYLWTEKASREFIEREYPWFLKTYDRYSFPVQRVDAVRYFLLLYYGGIYIDLDNGCMANLDPLTYYPMWITDGGRGALSNNVLASQPNHPFWTLLTQSLMPYNYHYFFPYATISYASGQWFETAIWEKYHALLPTADRSSMDHRLHRLMMDDREGADKWLFFTQERGGSWNHWDNYLFMMIGDHLMVFLLLLFSFLGAAGWLLVRFMRKYKKGEGYTRLRNQPDRHTV